jgi:hypothetical protein
MCVSKRGFMCLTFFFLLSSALWQNSYSAPFTKARNKEEIRNYMQIADAPAICRERLEKI